MIDFGKKVIWIFLLYVISTHDAYSQVVTSLPVFPKSLDSVEIFFDASQGSGGLASYTGNVYAHTGVITDKSASGSDWKYVKTSWGKTPLKLN